MLSLPLPITVADAFGAAAFAGSCLWPLMKKRRALLAGQAATNLMFITHYVLLGGTPPPRFACCGGPGAGRAAGRAQPLADRDLRRHGAGHRRHRAVHRSGLPSALSSLGITFSTLARWQSDAVRMRILLLVAGGFWVSHNALVMSPFAMASDAFCAAANLLRLRGLLRKGEAPAPVPAANANALPSGAAAA
ncbi:YgjV family protein [Azospirillum sp. B506]|uniref:YgjV family protein n=1 Tax=Azospirillum sp. B506 TaxID=137721 RepID=UPI00034B7E03|nr:YgjV family protein [Azospirillum sp. B506]